MEQMLYGFIMIDPTLTDRSYRTVMDSPGLKSFIIGVNSLEDACEEARILSENGCRLIELCADFTREMAIQIREATNNVAKVGHVVMLED